MLMFINFFDEICFNGVGCFTLAVTGPGAFPLSSGHSFSMGPPNPVDWQPDTCVDSNDCSQSSTCTAGLCENTGGFGAIVIVNLSDPTLPLSTAYFDDLGQVVGEPVFVDVHFKLLADIPESAPEALLFGNLVAADASSNSLSVTMQDEVFVSSE